jgi:hypothetical protein
MDEHSHIERLTRIETHLEHLTDNLERLVSRAEFQPVKLIAYGMASGVLTAFLAAVIVTVMGHK